MIFFRLNHMESITSSINNFAIPCKQIRAKHYYCVQRSTYRCISGSVTNSAFAVASRQIGGSAMNRAASFVVVVGRLVDRRRPAKRRPVCRDPSIAGIFTFRMCLKPRKYAHLAAQRCCRIVNLFRLFNGSIEKM